MSAIRDDGVIIEQGSVFRRSYAFNGLDLTGATARMEVRDVPGGDILLAIGMPPVDGSGIEIDVSTSSTNEVVSTVSLTALQDLTTDLVAGAVVMDVKVTSAAGEDSRLVEGRWRISAQVTV